MKGRTPERIEPRAAAGCNNERPVRDAPMCLGFFAAGAFPNSLKMNTHPTSHRYPATSQALALAAAVALCCTTAFAQTPSDDQPSVTPYRPSVSTPAALSAVGWLEFEAGTQHARGSDSERRDTLPYTLKLAFTPDWGVRIGGDAWVWQTDEIGQRLHGGGDSSIVLKRRFAVNDTAAFGLEAGVTLPVGRRGIGSGKSDYSLNAIYSADVDDYHTDLNLASTRVGAVDAGVSRAQTLWAASLSKSLTERWGIGGEFSGTRQRGTDSTRQALIAASYNVSKSLTLDAGVARSLRSGVPGSSVFTGLTMLVGRLF